MAFEIYREESHRAVQEPIITITRKRTLLLNDYAMDKYFKGIKSVLLMIDAENHKIGIKPLKKTEDGAYKLSFTSKEKLSTGQIAGKGFVRRYFGDEIRKRRFKARWNDKDKILEADIDERNNIVKR